MINVLFVSYIKEVRNFVLGWRVRNQSGIYCRSDLRNLQTQLDEAKSLYVSVCEAKDKLEDDLNKHWQEKVATEIQEVLSF